jgi:ABC-type multidrug transport system permease subunit
MAAVCFLVNRALNFGWALFCAALAYIFFCFLFGVVELAELMHWLARKNLKTPLWNSHRN